MLTLNLTVANHQSLFSHRKFYGNVFTLHHQMLPLPVITRWQTSWSNDLKVGWWFKSCSIQSIYQKIKKQKNNFIKCIVCVFRTEDILLIFFRQKKCILEPASAETVIKHKWSFQFQKQCGSDKSVNLAPEKKSWQKAKNKIHIGALNVYLNKLVIFLYIHILYTHIHTYTV